MSSSEETLLLSVAPHVSAREDPQTMEEGRVQRDKIVR